MADLTNKALNTGSKIVANISVFMSAIEALIALENERSSSGLTLSDFNAAFLASGELKHVSGSDLQAVLTSAVAVDTWMKEQFHDDNFHKARP